MAEQLQSSTWLEFFHGTDILKDSFEKSQHFRKIKIKKESTEENKMKIGRDGACSTSYPSGNQVDGLPLVAVLPK